MLLTKFPFLSRNAYKCKIITPKHFTCVIEKENFHKLDIINPFKYKNKMGEWVG
jgi:hypothetical protein